MKSSQWPWQSFYISNIKGIWKKWKHPRSRSTSAKPKTQGIYSLSHSTNIIKHLWCARHWDYIVSKTDSESSASQNSWFVLVLLPGKSHGQRSLVGCGPWVAKSRTRLSDFTFTFHFHALEKEMATHSSVLAWRIPGMGEPGWMLSMESHRVGHDWSDLAAAAAAGCKEGL